MGKSALATIYAQLDDVYNAYGLFKESYEPNKRPSMEPFQKRLQGMSLILQPEQLACCKPFYLALEVYT
jgi:hypothetical protein